MGFWGGVERGLEVAKKDQLNKDQIEVASRREERAEATFKLREDEPALQRMKDIRGMFSGGGGFEALSIGSGGGTSKSTGETTEHMMDVMSVMGVTDDALVRISSSGGTAAAGRKNLAKVYDIATAHNKALRSGKYQVDETGIGEIITQMINDAVYTQSKEIPLDEDFWTNFEERSSMTISDSERNTLGESYVQPGYVSFPNQPVLRDRASIGDVEKAQNFVNQKLVAEGTNEINKLLEGSNKLIQLQADGPPYAGEGASAEQEEAALTRIGHLEKFYQERTISIELARKEAAENNFAAIYNLYGREDILNPIYNQIGTFDPEILPDYNPASIKPINVGDKLTYGELYSQGLLKIGQVVIYEYTDPLTGERRVVQETVGSTNE